MCWDGYPWREENGDGCEVEKKMAGSYNGYGYNFGLNAANQKVPLREGSIDLYQRVTF